MKTKTKVFKNGASATHQEIKMNMIRPLSDFYNFTALPGTARYYEPSPRGNLCVVEDFKYYYYAVPKSQRKGFRRAVIEAFGSRNCIRVTGSVRSGTLYVKYI